MSWLRLGQVRGAWGRWEPKIRGCDQQQDTRQPGAQCERDAPLFEKLLFYHGHGGTSTLPLRCHHVYYELAAFLTLSL
jgi:hypothetical protein